MSIPKINLPPRGTPKFSSVSEFEMGPMVGDGGFARVFRATHKKSGAEFALKVMSLALMSEKDVENIEKELEIHSSLDSPLIVHLEDFFEENGKIFVVLGLMANGNLYKYMYKHFQLPLERALHFWKETVRAIEHLHSQNIYMRDLKPENILIAADLSVKLCDFGWASRMADEAYRRLPGGTYIYMSPENLRGELQGFASDMWSLGVLLFELVHYHEPYKIGLSAKEQLSYIKGTKIKFKESLPEHLRQMVLELLEWNADQRPSAAEVLAKPWVMQIEKATAEKGK